MAARGNVHTSTFVFMKAEWHETLLVMLLAYEVLYTSHRVGSLLQEEQQAHAEGCTNIEVVIFL